MMVGYSFSNLLLTHFSLEGGLFNRHFWISQEFNCIKQEVQKIISQVQSCLQTNGKIGKDGEA